MQGWPPPKVSRNGRKKESVRPMSQPDGKPVPLRLDTILRYHTIRYTLFFIANSDRSGSSESFSCDKPIGASPGRDYVLTRMVIQII